MKSKSILLILFLNIAAMTIVFPQGKMPPDHNHLSGTVINEKNQPIPYSKISIQTILSDQKKKEFLTYADKKGKFLLNLPITDFQKLEKVSLTITATPYTPSVKQFSSSSFNYFLKSQKLFKKSDFYILKIKDFTEVEWFSTDHRLLYTRQIDKMNIEKLLADKNYNSIKEYISENIKPSAQKHAYSFIGISLFKSKNFEKSKEYFEKCGNNLYFNLKGESYFKEKSYIQALNLLIQGELTVHQTDLLFQLAKIFESSKQTQKAITAYQNCLLNYSTILKSLEFKWNDLFVKRHGICYRKLHNVFNVAYDDSKQDYLLINILKKSKKYCETVDEMALYYFNKEKKTNKIYYNRKLAKALRNPNRFFSNFTPFDKIKFNIIKLYSEFDLQLINDNENKISEKRRVIKARSSRRFYRDLPNYKITKALYGPKGLIGSKWQTAFYYKILGKQKLFNTQTVIVEANPKIIHSGNRLSGKIWVDEKDGSILKIEWTPYGVNRTDIRKTSLILNRKPQLKFITEYNRIKNKIRFPSKCYIIESYLDANGIRFIRTKTDFEYTDYSFFILNMDATIEGVAN